MLETVLAVKEKHVAEHVINVIMGVSEKSVKDYGHDKLDCFADGADYDARFWMAVIRQALVAGFMYKEVENYGLLKLTDKGKKFIASPHSFMITKDHEYNNTDEEEDDEMGGGGAGGGGGADPQMFSMLKDLRKKIAKQKNVPPFVVFQDPSLEEMSIQYPITIDELKNITGVGAGKAVKYGKPFIELIAKYVEENEIERAVDMVVKSVVNKSGLKIYIIQNIDRKIALDDMAESKGITMSDLITEIESIVGSGTKIDINYYLNEVIDIDKQQEVFDFFRAAETDSVRDALTELGEDEYTEEEIRLMRIRFMSELGN